jgi:hypothetical protein
VVAEVIIIQRHARWRGGKARPRKPYRIKGSDWATDAAGGITVYRKNGDAIISLADGEWRKVRRG